MKKIKIFCLLLIIHFSLNSETFTYSFPDTLQYRIVSTQNQVVFVNGYFYDRLELLNRVLVELLDSDYGSGIHRIDYETMVLRNEHEGYELIDQSTIEFTIESNGYYTDIPIDSSTPSVRHIPTFPDREIYVGDTWMAPGEDVHDLIYSFGIDHRLHIPYNVFYTYLDKGEIDGKPFALFEINYNILHDINIDQLISRGFELPDVYPVQVTGSFNLYYWWDIENGIPMHMEEDYEFSYIFSNGGSQTFKADSVSDIVIAEIMNKEEVSQEIDEILDEEGLEDVTVEEVDEGVLLTIENLIFMPDSSQLVPGESSKLEMIGEILEMFPDRDILVTGHTARVGSEESCLELSRERAAIVVDYFLRNGVRDISQIFSEGMGSAEPLDDNSTEQGREKNRRVEITILEN